MGVSLFCVAGVFAFCMLCVSCMCGAHTVWSGCTVSLGAPGVYVCMLNSMVTSKETIHL